MAAYIDVAKYRSLSLAPADYTDRIEAIEPGWTLAQLDHYSAWIDSQLRKRYAAPFDPASVPPIIEIWLVKIVTAETYLKNGIDATDKQIATIEDRAAGARKEIDLAANSKDGLFDIPLRANTTASGITKGGPRSYAEASPYTWSKLQRDAARTEDERNGYG